MKYSFLFLLLYLTTPGIAQEIIEPCKFGQPLIDALQNSYTPDNPLGYGPARDILYSEIDNNGLTLSGIYTNYTITLDPNEDPSVSAYQNGAGLNAEHVYPQSMGAGDEPAKSDLHNIFPCKVNVNTVRGICPYAEIDDEETDQWFYLNTESSSIPVTDIDQYSEKDGGSNCSFEPRESVKGDIARAMFYFYAIYQAEANSANADFFTPQKSVLYQWHLTDPVDEKEWERDSLIAMHQGNNNPFIRDHSLAARAYFSTDASYPEGDPDCYAGTTAVKELVPENWASISANLIQDELTVYTKHKKANIFVFNRKGAVLFQQKAAATETYIPFNNLPQDVYIVVVRFEGAEKTFRVLKF